VLIALSAKLKSAFNFHNRYQYYAGRDYRCGNGGDVREEYEGAEHSCRYREQVVQQVYVPPEFLCSEPVRDHLGEFEVDGSLNYLGSNRGCLLK
jgi:hypothetical protein